MAQPLESPHGVATTRWIAPTRGVATTHGVAAAHGIAAADVIATIRPWSLDLGSFGGRGGLPEVHVLRWGAPRLRLGRARCNGTSGDHAIPTGNGPNGSHITLHPRPMHTQWPRPESTRASPPPPQR